MPFPSRCSRCENESAITLAYMSQSLCVSHFNRHFEKRFTNTIRRHALFSDGEKIGVGLSGGKDSVLLLHVLNKFFKHSNPLHAVIIDEGIPGYRDKAIAIAIKQCETENVPYTIVRFSDEFGVDNSDTSKALSYNPNLGKGVCGFCGTFRRTILNKYARELGLSKLATGHNLDDEAQSILMNVFDNHFEKFARQGPVAGDSEGATGGLVPRIKPFYETPEKEIIAYCAFNNIDHYSEVCCPHSKRAKRNDFRMLLNDFEAKYPGTKYSVLNFLLQAKKRMPHDPDPLNVLVGACADCGEPSNAALCQSCANTRRIRTELEKAKTDPRAAETIAANARAQKTKNKSDLTCNELKNQAT